MKLTFIQPGPLLPVRNGQQSTGYHLIQQLAQMTELSVVLLYRPGQSLTPEAAETLRQLQSEGINCTSFEISPSAMHRLAPIFLPRSLRSLAFTCLLNLPEKLRQLYCAPDNNCLYFGSSYDLFAHWHVLQPAGRYLFPADSIGYFQNNCQDHGLFAKCTRKLKRWFADAVERDLYRTNARRIFYVSEHDQTYVHQRQIGNPELTRTVRIGVSLPPERKQYTAPPHPIRIAFSGVLAYRPNEEAAFFLTDRMMPNLPPQTATLSLIGKDPSPVLASRASETVRVTGEVSDIYQELLQADLFISPLFTGAGAKNKILSALGCGLPVIGTSQSFSGFSEQPPGSLVFDSLETLLKRVQEIQAWNLDQWQKQGTLASDFIREHFTWKASASTLLKWIREDLNQPAA